MFSLHILSSPSLILSPAHACARQEEEEEEEEEILFLSSSSILSCVCKGENEISLFSSAYACARIRDRRRRFFSSLPSSFFSTCTFACIKENRRILSSLPFPYFLSPSLSITWKEIHNPSFSHPLFLSSLDAFHFLCWGGYLICHPFSSFSASHHASSIFSLMWQFHLLSSSFLAPLSLPTHPLAHTLTLDNMLIRHDNA